MVRKTKKETEKLKAWAKLMYTKENREGNEIAAIVEVSPQTISAWKKEGNWEALRVSYTRTKEEQLKDLYEQLNQFNSFIKLKAEGKRFPDSKEADALKKITASIKDLETELNISTIIDVCIDVTNFVRSTDFKKAQELNDIFDKYISSKV